MLSEQIKELMQRAGFDPAAIERMGLMPNAEKFVELIVKEYEKFLVENFSWVHSKDYGTIKCCDIPFVTRKHFGIK